MTRRYRTARPFTAERAIQRLEAETRFRLDLAHIAGMRAERRRIDRELGVLTLAARALRPLWRRGDAMAHAKARALRTEYELLIARARALGMTE